MTTQNAFCDWLDTFISEKGIDLEDSFEIDLENSFNIFTYGVIVEHIKIAPASEQRKIKDVIVQIDFKNGDVRHFFRHLAKALAVNQDDEDVAAMRRQRSLEDNGCL